MRNFIANDSLGTKFSAYPTNLYLDSKVIVSEGGCDYPIFFKLQIVIVTPIADDVTFETL